MKLEKIVRKVLKGSAVGVALGSTGCAFHPRELPPVYDGSIDGSTPDSRVDASYDGGLLDARADGSIYDSAVPDAAIDGGLADAVVDSGLPDSGVNVGDFHHPYGCDGDTVVLYHFDSPSALEDACGSHDLSDLGSAGVVGKDAEFKDARSFDGVNDYLSTPDAVDLDFGVASDFTAEAWFRTSVVPNDGDTIVGKLNSSPSGWRIAYSSAGGLVCQYWEGAAVSQVGAPVSFVDGNWHHVACVRGSGGASAALYFDGGASASGPITPRNVDNAVSLTVGNTVYGVGYNAQWFAGDVDEVRVSKVARTYTP